MEDLGEDPQSGVDLTIGSTGVQGHFGHSTARDRKRCVWVENQAKSAS